MASQSISIMYITITHDIDDNITSSKLIVLLLIITFDVVTSKSAIAMYVVV